MKKVVFLLIVLVALGITYKLVLLKNYYVEEVKFNKDTIFNQTIIVKHTDDNDKVFTYEDMVLKDDFSDWERRSSYYVYLNENKEVSKAISIGKDKQYYLDLRSDSYVAGDGAEDIFTESDRVKFVNDHNIHSDIDLYNYIKDNYYFSSGIFNSIKKIKQNFIVNSFVAYTALISEEYNPDTRITLIDGDLKGYINNVNEKIKGIHILHNDEQYIITLLGEEMINNEYITNLLNSISFNNEY